MSRLKSKVQAIFHKHPKLNVRMNLWLLVSLALSAIIFMIAPQQLPVSIYKLSLITTAAWVAYWIDRGLFPYARPSDIYEMESHSDKHAWSLVFAISMLRRAIIIAAAMIGVALGA